MKSGLTGPVFQREAWLALITFRAFTKWILYKLFHDFAWEWQKSGLQFLLCLTRFCLTYSLSTSWNSSGMKDLLTLTAIHQPSPLPLYQGLLKIVWADWSWRAGFGRFGPLFPDLQTHLQTELSSPKIGNNALSFFRMGALREHFFIFCDVIHNSHPCL